MKQFKFNVHQILERKVIVEAENADEAEEKLKDALYEDKIQFDTDIDFHGNEIEQETETGWPIEMDDDVKQTYTGFADDYITADGERYYEGKK